MRQLLLSEIIVGGKTMNECKISSIVCMVVTALVAVKISMVKLCQET